MVKLNINTIKRISFDRNGQGKIEGSFENLLIKITRKTNVVDKAKSTIISNKPLVTAINGKV